MTIYDGRKFFYQWDLNQKITSNTLAVGDEIHFFNMNQPNALVVKTYALDGLVVADVPNILLQAAIPIKVWKYHRGNASAQTIEEYIFKVRERAQPDEYEYTETELYDMKIAAEEVVSYATRIKEEIEPAEAERLVAETARTSAETKRLASEELRVAAESNRTIAEQARTDAETAREAAERERESAETLRQTTFEQSYNNVANALKGTASGEVIRVDDVSPVEHLVKMKVSGKNLARVVTGYKSFGGEIATTVIKTDTSGLRRASFVKVLPGQSYTITKSGSVETGNNFRYFWYDTFPTVDVTNSIGGEYIPNTNTRTITAPQNAHYLFIMWTADNEKYPCGNVQCELGNTATEYTPYIDPTTVTVTRYSVDETNNPKTYIPSTDGTCDIDSMSPTMTLVTDTEGVTIEVEYNRDINVVIKDILNRLGGD